MKDLTLHELERSIQQEVLPLDPNDPKKPIPKVTG